MFQKCWEQGTLLDIVDGYSEDMKSHVVGVLEGGMNVELNLGYNFTYLRKHREASEHKKELTQFFVSCSFGWPENNTDDRYLVGHKRLPLGLRLGLSFYPLVYESVSSGIQSSGNLKMSRNEDHHRQGRRFAAGGNGPDGRDPRDVEIKRLRQRVRELEINPFDRCERQYEDTPTDTTVEEYENKEIPEFEGRLCPGDFLDWLRTVDRIFDLRDTPDHIKVKLIAIRLKNMLLYGGIMCKINGTGRVLTLIDEADPLYDTEDEVETEVNYPDWGELLVTHQLLNTDVLDQDNDTTWLRTNIFRTQCTAKGLPIQNHLDPYQLTWLKKGNLVKVTHRCLVHFSIGNKYTDELWCEVIPMDACRILLGRPWLYDRRVKHDGYRNTYKFKKDGVSITLAPLNPKDAPPDRVLISKTDFVGIVKVSPPAVVFGLLMIEENLVTAAAPLSMVPLLKEFKDVLEYWRHYLLPTEFILYSDHQALKFIQGQAKLKPRYAKWVETLQEFSFVIRHKSRSANSVADALSRRPALLSSISFQVLGFAPFAHLYQDDPDFKELWDKCHGGIFR
nr:hypothetical protein [Tanacetum cinerariifolium]